MITEDFKAKVIASNIILKTKMFLGLTIGVLSMAVLAIWA